MRYAAVVEMDLPADVIERSPTLWDKCRAGIGVKVDLSTERVRNRIEAATFLYEVRGALDALGVDNARSLVVDGIVVFEDPQRRPNDLVDLMLAFGDHALLLSESCRHLRLGVEHEEAGLHLEIEAGISLEHDRREPAALVSILGRVLDLDPRSLESTEAYRARIERFVSEPKLWAIVKVQFAAFVSRLEQALGVALPGASMRTTVRTLGFEAPWADDANQPALSPSGQPSLVSDPRRSKVEAPRKARSEETFSPTRNFTLSLEQRIAAALTGPPPFAVRLRKIEELQAQLVDELAASAGESLDSVSTSVVRGLEE